MKILTQAIMVSATMLSAIAASCIMGMIGESAIAATLKEDTPTITSTRLLSAATLNLPTFQLPALTGSYSVGTVSYRMSDVNRTELSGVGERQLMTKVWYPSESTPHAVPGSYMPETMAAVVGAIQGFPPEMLLSIQPHAIPGATVAAGQSQYPVVVLSHGGAGSFLEQYTTLAEELASHGYVVVGVSHTYDAAVTAFPDGEIVIGEPQRWLPAPGDTAEQIEQKRQELVNIRTADVRFVLDELERINQAGSGILAGRMQLDQVGIFGHSIGGMTATEALKTDSRFRAAIGLDSDITQSLINTGLKHPFMLLSAEQPDPLAQAAFDQLRDQLFAQMGADAYNVVISGAGHATFSDLPALWPLLSQFFPLNPDLPEDLQLALIREYLQIGLIDESRSATIVNTYSRLFFDQYLRNIKSPLLQTPLPGYPEIATVKFQPGGQPAVDVPEPDMYIGLGVLATLLLLSRRTSSKRDRPDAAPMQPNANPS